MEKLLIIDDEKGILDLLTHVFKKEGYGVSTAMNAKRAIEIIDKENLDLILTDIKLPQKSGLEIMKHVLKTRPDVPVILMTAYGTIKQSVEALKAGAVDYVVKPFDVEELKIIIRQNLEKRSLKEENVRLRKELREKYEFRQMIGKSKKIQEVFDLIEKIAPTDSTVLITGESGTGKEMAARAIHDLGPRREKPFVSLNCGALPENLLESELFGHAKGAFTGAIANKKGMFEVAEKGTLLLDEIGEMSPMTQVKVLRALQERTIRQVGGTQEIPVDVRIICSTNQNLKEMIERGEFREDLFYRLNVLSLVMPPLRERNEDIPVLISHFLNKYSDKMGRPKKRIIPSVLARFESFSWPGNIRELENVIERIVAIEERETITLESIPLELYGSPNQEEPSLKMESGFNLNKTLDSLSSGYAQEALDASNGNLKLAADMLGINYRSMRYMIEKFGLQPRKIKAEKRQAHKRQ